MPCWLMKSEPECFSIDHLRRKRTAPWDGVRNYQARNYMRAMQVGDSCIFYHSNAKPSGAAGVCVVARKAYPDHTAWDPTNEHYDPADGPKVQRWSMVDVRYKHTFGRFLPLEMLRDDRELAGMVLFSRGRLSVQPVSDEHFAHIVALGG
ncbi:MAG: EVE domain-containing protein [Planctomycetota bacterium]